MVRRIPEDLLHDQRGETERWLVEQQELRPQHGVAHTVPAAVISILRWSARLKSRGQPVVGFSLGFSIVPWPRSHASEVLERQSSPVIHAINTEQTFEASIGSGYFLQITRSHLEALISGFNTNVDRDSSEQWCSRVTGKEAFDSLGSFLGCLRRISSAQLASLDSIRDRLVDLRWNPRLTSTGLECQVLK